MSKAYCQICSLPLKVIVRFARRNKQGMVCPTCYLEQVISKELDNVEVKEK